MGFRAWIERTDEPVFASFAKDGTVIAYIDGKRYVYLTDALSHAKWQKILRNWYPGAGWDVLNDIKKRGEQLEPPNQTQEAHH